MPPVASDLRFAVVSDVHLSFRPDDQGCPSTVSPPEQRLAEFLAAAREWDADVVFNLGDLHPRSLDAGPATRVLDSLRSFPGETISVLGNHDADTVDRDAFMDAVDMPATYYSRLVEGWTVIVLDSGDPAYAPGTPEEHPAPDQLEWFRAELERAPGPCVVLVHNGTDDVFPGGRPPAALTEIVADANDAAGYQKVAAYFWGHDHRTRAFRSDGVDYVLFNSSTYRWDADAGPLFYGEPAPYGLGVLGAEHGRLRLDGTGTPDNWAIEDCTEIPADARPDDDETYQVSVDGGSNDRG